MTRRPTKYDDEVPVFPGMGDFEFYAEDHSTERSIVEDSIVIVDSDGIVGEIVNPSDKPTRKKWFSKNESLWRFQFGAYGDTRLLVWSKGVDDGLEIAADWLATNAPGHLMAEGSDELKSLRDEAREELGEDADDEEVDQSATADLTYTEAGYLTSYEWTVDEAGDKGLLEAAMYASELVDYRFHYNKSGIDIVDLHRDDVYLFVNPNTPASAFWSVEGRRNSDKIGIIVLGSSESHAERQATPVLDNMLGGDFTMLADEISESEELYWPLMAISSWVQAKRPGPFELLPAIEAEQTANARAQSGGHPIPASKGGGVVVVYIDKAGDWTAVFSGGQWDKEAGHGMHQMYGREGWGDGHAGSHLGKKTRWEDVPDHIRRRIESQLGDMRSNSRRRNSSTHTYAVSYVHQISPRQTEAGPEVDLSGSLFSDSGMYARGFLTRALIEKGVLEKGARVASFRVEGDEIIVYPKTPGQTTYQHAVVLKDLGRA
jgi:hypothetical protein